MLARVITYMRLVKTKLLMNFFFAAQFNCVDDSWPF